MAHRLSRKGTITGTESVIGRGIGTTKESRHLRMNSRVRRVTWTEQFNTPVELRIGVPPKDRLLRIRHGGWKQLKKRGKEDETITAFLECSYEHHTALINVPVAEVEEFLWAGTCSQESLGKELAYTREVIDYVLTELTPGIS